MFFLTYLSFWNQVPVKWLSETRKDAILSLNKETLQKQEKVGDIRHHKQTDMKSKKCELVVLTRCTSMRNVYICEIFSCYSGYPSVFLFRLMHFFATEQTWVFMRTTTLRILHSTHLCQQVWSLVQYTALRLGLVTFCATLFRSLSPKEGTWGELASIPTTTSARRAGWTLIGYPALQEAMVCSQSATKEGQDNNLLVAMK